jgi:hypothetical protein
VTVAMLDRILRRSMIVNLDCERFSLNDKGGDRLRASPARTAKH